MTNLQQFKALFLGATRLQNSINGNPVWMVHTSIGDLKTEPDAQIGHKISDYVSIDGPDSLMGKAVAFSYFQHRQSTTRWLIRIDRVSEAL